MQLPQDWKELSKDDRSSTIAYFVGGWAKDDGDEVLIWRGTEDEDEIHLTSHLGNDAPDDAEYIIEVHEDDELKQELFAHKEGEAFNRARQKLILMEEL